MKKIILLFFLISGFNQSFAQSLCHEGSGGGPCFRAEKLDNGSFDILLEFGSNEKCECPHDVKVNVVKNAQGKYITVYGSYSITLNIQDDWVVYLEVKRIKEETNCCKLLEGNYSQPGE
jgi:hypothetical protein